MRWASSSSRSRAATTCDRATAARRDAFAIATEPAREPPLDEGRGLAGRLINLAAAVTACSVGAGARVAGALDGAELLAHEALARDPESFQAHNALATVLDARGETAPARRERAQARRLNPLAPAPAAPRLGPDGRPLSDGG